MRRAVAFIPMIRAVELTIERAVELTAIKRAVELITIKKSSRIQGNRKTVFTAKRAVSIHVNSKNSSIHGKQEQKRP